MNKHPRPLRRSAYRPDGVSTFTYAVVLILTMLTVLVIKFLGWLVKWGLLFLLGLGVALALWWWLLR